jgi:hypothetical protein
MISKPWFSFFFFQSFNVESMAIIHNKMEPLFKFKNKEIQATFYISNNLSQNMTKFPFFHKTLKNEKMKK